MEDAFEERLGRSGGDGGYLVGEEGDELRGAELVENSSFIDEVEGGDPLGLVVAHFLHLGDQVLVRDQVLVGEFLVGLVGAGGLVGLGELVHYLNSKLFIMLAS